MARALLFMGLVLAGAALFIAVANRWRGDYDPDLAWYAPFLENNPDVVAPLEYADVTARIDIPYREVDGVSVLMDVYFREERPAAPRPAALFIHGGSWSGGTKLWWARQAKYFAHAHNFFAVSIDYRLTDIAAHPAQVEDSKAAMRWLRAHAEEYNIDPKRILVGGGSAGGHLAALVAYTSAPDDTEGEGIAASSHADLAIIVNGEIDLVDLHERGLLVDKMHRLLGAALDEDRRRYEEASPLYRVHAGAPPTLLLHGADDSLVPADQSRALYARLRALGVHAEMEIYPGKGHAWYNWQPDFEITLRRMEQFVVEQFGLEAASTVADTR